MIDASDPRAPAVLGTVAIGFQPDSLKLVERDGKIVAVVSIDNEPLVVDQHGSVLDEDLPGFPTSGSAFPQDRSPASAIGTTIPTPTDGSGRPVSGGPLQPDAIAFSPDGSLLFTADEGELDLTSGRGFSGFTVDGRRVFDDRDAMEELAVRFGQYADGRSENRGIEVEGIAAATYGRQDFQFVMSERGSVMAGYALAAGRRPRFVQFLPTGISPEGVMPIPQRNLLVTADEVSGTMTIFRVGLRCRSAWRGRWPSGPNVRSALSGFA